MAQTGGAASHAAQTAAVWGVAGVHTGGRVAFPLTYMEKWWVWVWVQALRDVKLRKGFRNGSGCGLIAGGLPVVVRGFGGCNKQ